jgi:hypothetical protein
MRCTKIAVVIMELPLTFHEIYEIVDTAPGENVELDVGAQTTKDKRLLGKCASNGRFLRCNTHFIRMPTDSVECDKTGE